MQSFDKTVALGPSDCGFTVIDRFHLQEQLIRMMILAATDLTSVIAQNGHDFRVMLLEERQYIVVEHMHSGDR